MYVALLAIHYTYESTVYNRNTACQQQYNNEQKGASHAT